MASGFRSKRRSTSPDTIPVAHEWWRGSKRRALGTRDWKVPRTCGQESPRYGRRAETGTHPSFPFSFSSSFSFSLSSVIKRKRRSQRSNATLGRPYESGVTNARSGCMNPGKRRRHSALIPASVSGPRGGPGCRYESAAASGHWHVTRSRSRGRRRGRPSRSCSAGRH